MQYFVESDSTLEHAYINLDETLDYAQNDFYNRFEAYNFPTMLVVDNDFSFFGIMTEKDLQKAIANNPNADRSAIKVKDFCNHNCKRIMGFELENHKKNNTDPFENLPPSMSFLPVINDRNKIVCIIFSKKHLGEINKGLQIDICDVCQLKCPACPRGRGELQNTSNQMSLDTFEKVISKAVSIGVTYVEMINFTEPFFVKNLYEYMLVLKRYGINKRVVSTNFSLPDIKNLDKFLESGFTDLWASVSGFTQKMHEKYHRGSDINVVKRNLEFCAKIMAERKLSGVVSVKYLNFGYNTDEIESFREYAKGIGLNFMVYKGYGHDGSPPPPPIKQFQGEESEESFDEKSYKIFSKFFRSYNKISSEKKNFEVCNQFYQIPLDYNADVYVCCRYGNSPYIKIGNFLKDDYSDIMLNRLMHPLCQICNEKRSMPMPKELRDNIMRQIAK